MTDVGTFLTCSYGRRWNVRRNNVGTFVGTYQSRDRAEQSREAVLTSLDDLALGLWSFVFGEIDHHLKSLTREPMMIGATR